MSRLVVMGSGETAPTMVRVHREILATVGTAPAVLLDTPFAFQMNAAELVTRTVTYFAQSVGHAVQPARWPHRDAPVAEQERTLALLGRAGWVFAGPGSPTYALRHWRGTAVPATMAAVVARGGTLVMGSAAAVTLGAFAVPVYEIYKVGEEPHWVEGLDLLRELTGLAAVVVPHFDNREGGTHDTRFCYLGERRLVMLERQLPDEVGVLGVDEHTAAILDLAARTLTVAGGGAVTVRRSGDSQAFRAGQTLGFDDLAALLRLREPTPQPTLQPTPNTPFSVDHAQRVRGDEAQPHDRGKAGARTHSGAEPFVHDQRGGVAVGAEPFVHDQRGSLVGVGEARSLREAADAAQRDFEAAYAERDVESCVAAALAVEGSIADWRADTLQSDDQNHARRVLRAMLVRLGELAAGGANPSSRIAPALDLLLELRTRAREGGDFATSDDIRDRLSGTGVEVRDTPDGPVWTLREP